MSRAWSCLLLSLVMTLLLYTNCIYATLTAQWMGDLYSSRQDTKLKDVLIPATHNSGTSSMHLFSKISPGDTQLFQLIRPTVFSWSRCQFLTVYQQLVRGVRKFDFRIAFVKGKPYIVHAMVSQPFKEALLDIKRFTLRHPKEVVLIQYRKYFPLKQRDAKVLNIKHNNITRDLIYQVLGSSIKDFSHNWSFQDFWSHKKSVMILREIDDFWPNTTNLQDLKAKSLSYLNRRDPQRFHEISLIFTPSTKLTFFLKPRIPWQFGNTWNALSVLSKPIREVGVDWLNDWFKKGQHINIVSSDFVGLWSFAKSMVEINRKKL